MNQFQVFMDENLTPTDKVSEPLIKSKEVMSRHDIYHMYYGWHDCKDNILVETIFLTEEQIQTEKNQGKKFRRFIPYVLKYPKIIGRNEFYKKLTENYGKPPLINPNNKQYSYYFKKIPAQPDEPDIEYISAEERRINRIIYGSISDN
jgi:hypothetical protein